ncbi:hypothetical protein BC826DRAFT_1019318, partial [Russula brevipes]
MQTRRFATSGTREPAYAIYRSKWIRLSEGRPDKKQISRGVHHLGACRSSHCLHHSSQHPLQTFIQKTYHQSGRHWEKFGRN